MAKRFLIITRFSKFWVFFFPISSFLFYNYVGFNNQICKAIYFFSVPITIFYSFPELRNKHRHTLYSNIIRNILFLTMFSMIMAYFFWGQDLMLSYRVTASYLAIVYFFYLMQVKPDLSIIEKLIWFYCIFYIMLWLYALIRAPNLTFGFEPETGIDNSRGIFRLEIPGHAFVALGFFVALVKFVETKKIKWVVIFSILFIIIILHVTRQVIIFSFLVGLFYLLKEKKYLWIWLLTAYLFITFICSVTVANESVIGKLFSVSQEQASQQMEGDRDIRIKEYQFFFIKYSKNILTDIFGNGVAHSESDFGKLEINIANKYYFFGNDVGYADLFIRLGIMGMLCYGYIFYRVINQKVPLKFMYAKLFIIYLIFANIAASWIFQDVIAICICLYILEINNLKQKNKYNFISKAK